MEFSIEGMTCAGCSAAVERAISRVEGVGTASVNLLLNRAQVVPAAAGSAGESALDALAESVVKAVDMAGYTAHYEKKKS